MNAGVRLTTHALAQPAVPLALLDYQRGGRGERRDMRGDARRRSVGRLQDTVADSTITYPSGLIGRPVSRTHPKPQLALAGYNDLKPVPESETKPANEQMPTRTLGKHGLIGVNLRASAVPMSLELNDD